MCFVGRRDQKLELQFWYLNNLSSQIAAPVKYSTAKLIAVVRPHASVSAVTLESTMSHLQRAYRSPNMHHSRRC